MRLVVQRVKSASVHVNGNTVSSIGPGIMALVGIHEHDTENDLDHCCKRLLQAKLWENDDGKPWRQSVKQKNYSLLLVSQFTLYGTLTKGKPNYERAMKTRDGAEEVYGRFLNMVKDNYDNDKVYDGIFGEMMDVELVNDGPVTIIIESDVEKKGIEDGKVA